MEQLQVQQEMLMEMQVLMDKMVQQEVEVLVEHMDILVQLM